LTPTERRIARYLVNGFTSKEIALAMGSSPRTVEVHRANMIRKMGVRNSFELVSRLLAGAG
jgi:DNA-binding CsgD family transcriptional regulator